MAIPSFNAEVQQNFDAWDKNHDGVLSAQELDAVVSDPRVTGEAAAAAAALKMMVRGGRFLLPPLTRDYFTAYAAYASAHTRPAVFGAPVRDDLPAAASADASAASGTPHASASAYPGYQSAYRTAVRRIKATGAALFVGDSPSLFAIKQGHIGDCFFLAVVGGYLHRDPADVRNMISSNADGSYDVAFPSGRKVHVAAITDADIALGSGSTGTGRWISVLEAAYGSLRSAAERAATSSGVDTDSIANGGSLRLAMRTLTGHVIERLGLRQSGVVEMPEEADIAAKLPAIREAVDTALKDKRLIGATTADTDRPIGITPRHAYAVIGYDANADTITLWNPHGQNFNPQGEPDLKNGYPTKSGVFTVPLIDFARIFSGLDWETDRIASTVPAATTFPPTQSIFLKRLAPSN